MLRKTVLGYLDFMQAPIKLPLPFDSLIGAIAALDRDDQIQLRRILDHHINKTEESVDSAEAFLIERGCKPPLKEGLPLTSSPARSGQSNVSIDHDYIVSQQFKEDN